VTIHARPFTASDAHVLAAIVTNAALSTPGCPYWHVGDVWWGLYQNMVFDPRPNIRLWFDGTEPVGYAWVDPDGSIATQVVAGRTDVVVLVHELLEWAEERCTELLGEERRRSLSTTAFADDEGRIALLTQRGYERASAALHHFQRPLSDELSHTPSPCACTVRPVGDESQWLARVELHREVWHPSKVTLEAYRRLRTAPGYRPDLDLVAVTDDGALAAYCICWLDPLTQTGEFEPVGTRTAFRRQGLARNVLLEGMRRLREHGATQAIVCTLPVNTGARALYESAGFRIVGTEYRYSKR
jgi:mycothiol synthase